MMALQGDPVGKIYLHPDNSRGILYRRKYGMVRCLFAMIGADKNVL